MSTSEWLEEALPEDWIRTPWMVVPIESVYTRVYGNPACVHSLLLWVTFLYHHHLSEKLEPWRTRFLQAKPRDAKVFVSFTVIFTDL